MSHERVDGSQIATRLDGARIIGRELVQDLRPDRSRTHELVDLGDLKQGAVTAEAGAERRHPPVPASRARIERRLEDEIHTWAAHVAVIAQYGGTPSGIVLRQFEPLADSRKNFSTAGMQDPARNVVARELFARQAVGQYALHMRGRD